MRQANLIEKKKHVPKKGGWGVLSQKTCGCYM